MTAEVAACAGCLRRAALIASLAGRIDVAWRLRAGRPRLLALADEELLEWAGWPEAQRGYEAFNADFEADRVVAAGCSAVCRCSPAYPPALHDLPDPPAVLFVRGRFELVGGSDGAAIVGSRTASDYGRQVARALAAGLAKAGVAVVSGMALGIDEQAHRGALEAGGPTVAVLGCGADRPYPRRSRALHERIAATGCVVSELPPGAPPRRWTFPARNRLIAALSVGTIVVEGGERSGSLITADFASELGRFVAAVPGQVTARMAAGPHLLLKSGAELVRDAHDVLDLLYGATAREAPAPAPLVIGVPAAPQAPAGAAAPPADLDPRLLGLLRAIEDGRGTFAELSATPDAARSLALDLGELELRGLVRRVFGGRYVRAAP
jgi:DNA processing protein